ncbi:response regulator transcription factor [Aeromicrobium sp. P5_D10]
MDHLDQNYPLTIASETRAAERCRHIAEIILLRSQADAVGLMGISPIDGAQFPMLNTNYAPETFQHHASARYIKGQPGVRQILRRPGVIHCWEDIPGFRGSFEATTVYGPAGFNNGMSVVLATAAGLPVAMLHISTRLETVDPETKNLVEAVQPLLAEWAATMGRFELAKLSTRETEVLTMIRDGLSNVEIAASLVLSPRTVTTHVEHILRKLGASNRTEAAVLAERFGLERVDHQHRVPA